MWIGTIACALLLASALAGCTNNPPAAIVEYRQIGACNGFKHDGVLTSAGVGHSYLILSVTNVRNTSSGAQDFNFDPAIFYVNTEPRASANSSNLASLNPFTAQPALVKAGTTRAIDGNLIFLIPGEAKEANETSYHLLASPPSGSPGMLGVKLDLNQTKWPNIEDCSRIDFNISP